MANELHAYTDTGLTLYAVLLDSTGQVWNGAAFVALNGANWTSYDIAMTEATAGIYLADMPTTLAGTYTYAVYEQAGVNPATSDALKGSGALDWDGTAVVVLAAGGYATVAQLRDYLRQVPAGAAYDADLLDVIERATGMIDLELGFSFATFGAAAAKDVRAGGGEWLYPPAYAAGSITEIKAVYSKGTTSESTDAITDYDTDESARPYRLYRYLGWARGGWYRITAQWGYGTASPAIVQLCLEVARDLWQARDGNMSSLTVGVEGGGSVGVQYAWTHRQWKILEQTRLSCGEFGVA